MKFGGLPYEMHRLGGRNEVRSSPPWRRGDKDAREGGGGVIYCEAQAKGQARVGH